MAAVHQLFVIVDGPPAGKADTAAVLRFVAKAKLHLAAIGVQFKVVQVTAAMLKNPRVVEAFRAASISGFPAAKTQHRVYVGAQAITGIYTQALRQFRDRKARGTAAAAGEYGGESPDDLYRNYIAGDIDIRRAAQDTGDDGIGSTEDMMKLYQQKMQERQQINERRKGSQPAYLSPPAGAPLDTGDAIGDLISQVSAPVTSDTLRAAFGDEGGADAREDLMLRAFWENQSESI